jgi:membrane protein YdbS with pleckstrin-like domain
MNINRLQLEADEKILLQVRKHWFVIVVQIFGVVILSVLPYFVYVFIQEQKTFQELIRSNVPTGVIISLLCAWLLIMWMTVFNIWNNYYLDVWTFTNKRLIAVDQKGFFFRTTASFRLDRLQDVQISVNGILATFLDFGTLEMQTAGEQRNFKANSLPSPGELKSIILKTSAVLHKRHSHSHDGT